MSDQSAQSDSDVLIVGAGPTGAVAAKRFAEAGMRVVALEQGDWPDYSKARANHPDFELTLGRYWSGNPNRRQAPADYPIDDKDSDISPVLYNAVGGGTVIYAAHWQRNVPSDFRVRTLDGVGDDWPLTYEDLQPFYERVEADFGVSGLAGQGPAASARAARADGPPRRAGAQQAWLALVARAERDCHSRLRSSPALHTTRHLHVGLRRRRERFGGRHALAAERPPGRAARHRRARSPPRNEPERTGYRRRLRGPGRQGTFSKSSDHCACRQWHWHVTSSVALHIAPIAERTRQLCRPRRQAADAASIRHRRRPVRG